MATKEASSSKKNSAASSGKTAAKPASNLSAKAAAAATRIADNNKATCNSHLQERFESGIVLQAWGATSLTAGTWQLNDRNA